MDHQRAMILWILIVSILESGDTVEIHDPKDKSICPRYHRVTETKNVPYEETFFNDYGYRRTRTNYRMESVTTWKELEMCCDGYKPDMKDAEAPSCVPICLSDCLSGACVRPNQCTCVPGYRNVTNELTGYNECVPVCSSGCHGGRCTGPNICECDMGYLLAKDQGSCEPICAIFDFGHQGCGHDASCVAPNTCQCDHGYVATVNSSTIPDPNFTSGNVWKTKDLLENGKRPTFNARDVICRPSCEPGCGDNSNCVAPNKCECRIGYGEALMPEQGKNGSLCVPTCKQTCFNGFCAAPNECSCDEGYKPHELLNEDLCEPICHKECVNGKCTRPDNCECFDGYQKLILGAEPHETLENVCTPVCFGQCPNGTCVSPGQCRCNAGYVLDSVRMNETGTGNADSTISRINPLDHRSQQFCRPTCKPDCPTGSTCTAPNHCRSEAKLDDRMYNISATIHTRIVNSTRDCGDKGAVYEENEACGCEYRVDGKKFIEPGLCAIIFTPYTEEYFEFKRIDVMELADAASFNTTDWMFRTSKCRTLILSKKMEDAVSKKTEHCYLLQMHGFPNYGTVEPAMRPSYESENETIICFSSAAEIMCGPVEPKIVNDQVGRVAEVVVGTIALIALIGGLVAAIYLARRRLRKIGVFGATSRSKGNIMEQSETMESPLHTLDGPRV